jgi:hypothetical protein
MATQAEKINNLDKEVSLIKKDIQVIKENHLKHIEADLKHFKLVGYGVAGAVFTQLLIAIRDLLV